MFQNKLLLLPPHFMEELLNLIKVKYLAQGHLDNKTQLCSTPAEEGGRRGEERRNADIGSGPAVIPCSCCALRTSS